MKLKLPLVPNETNYQLSHRLRNLHRGKNTKQDRLIGYLMDMLRSKPKSSLKRNVRRIANEIIK